MFTVVRGNNGRTIYIGRVTAKNDHGFRLIGTEWNSETQSEEERQIECQFDPEVMEKAKKIKVNNYLLVMMIPSRTDPNKGVAEVLGFLGDVMTITNDKGNEKKVVMGSLRGIKKSRNANISILSMMNLVDDGHWVGNPSEFTSRNGVRRTNYWTNFLACNSTMYNRMLADRADRVLTQKDIVLFIYHSVENDHNGAEMKITHFIDNFYLLYRPRQDANSEKSNHQTAQSAGYGGSQTSGGYQSPNNGYNGQTQGVSAPDNRGQNTRTAPDAGTRTAENVPGNYAPSAPGNGYDTQPNTGYQNTPRNTSNENPPAQNAGYHGQSGDPGYQNGAKTVDQRETEAPARNDFSMLSDEELMNLPFS